MPLRAKLAVLFLIVLGISVASGLWGVHSGQRSLTEINALNRSYTQATAAQGLEAAFYRYDAARNAYVLAAAAGLPAGTLETTQAADGRAFTRGLAAFARSVRDPAAGAVLRGVESELAAYRNTAAAVDASLAAGRVRTALRLESARPAVGIGSGLARITALITARNARETAEVVRVQHTLIGVSLWAIGLFLLASLVIWILTEALMIRPTISMARLGAALAQGRLDGEVRFRSRDELGRLAEDFRRLMAYMRALARSAEAVGRGDLTVPPEPLGPQDTLGLALKEMHERLRAMLGRIQETSRTLEDNVARLRTMARDGRGAASQVATAVQQVAEATTEQSHGLQQIATTMQQLKASVEQVAAGAEGQAQAADDSADKLERMVEAIRGTGAVVQRVRAIAEDTRATARQGRQEVEATLAAMGRIAEVVEETAGAVDQLGQRSARIGAIVETISDIAAQTNLLALNANIEAARAGEHGRGFGVVADEVRKLAERAARATDEIAELVHGIQNGVESSVETMGRGRSAVEEGQRLARDAHQALDAMEQAIQRVTEEIGTLVETSGGLEERRDLVAERVQQITRTARENSQASQEMAAASNSVSDILQGLAAISEETAASTEEVAASTHDMAATMEQLEGQANGLAEVAGSLEAVAAGFRF
ncbi:putative Methyl-accepting chemotaxis protein [Candidatus Hydrogenisulfobacillus filiaventi]|uniref:Putative Methyl-accepting chemotaxis protein n=1 Tax=Candidatus Hydrogenisulfobacillus filiaventi TaxID=2707344 RepID=A0A6F8ZDH6_9FIRM|nr:methyl-accepting chemotaxis protein [Bacillota bacterium]CAB1127659.1 putative Methyl-accepting chemotaxis protein [Candidatus Hydrogenisulfobacillus filiaventi]